MVRPIFLSVGRSVARRRCRPFEWNHAVTLVYSSCSPRLSRGRTAREFLFGPFFRRLSSPSRACGTAPLPALVSACNRGQDAPRRRLKSQEMTKVASRRGENESRRSVPWKLIPESSELNVHEAGEAEGRRSFPAFRSARSHAKRLPRARAVSSRASSISSRGKTM